MSNNIFIPPENLPEEFEYFQTLLETDNILIEKIISKGQITPENQWLEQDKDEWVILLQGEAEISFENPEKKVNISLKSGDHLFIQKNQRHRVEKTSANPECIWLAVHF